MNSASKQPRRDGLRWLSRHPAEVAKRAWYDGLLPFSEDVAARCFSPTSGWHRERHIDEREREWRCLCRAVLCDALWRLRPRHSSVGGDKSAETGRWFADPDLDVAINLRDVCDALSLGDPVSVSRTALRWAAADTAAGLSTRAI
jgi:hypothetical protein